MRKAQDRMAASKPYAQKMRTVIGHLANASTDVKHPFLEAREDVKTVGIIVVATDRGLCGGLNANMFRKVVNEVAELQKDGINIKFTLVGRKATAFFRRFGGDVLGQVENLGDTPHLSDLIGPVKTMLDAYKDGEIDRLYLASSDFVNTMTQRAEFTQILPVVPGTDEELPENWDYVYEPSAEALLDGVLMRYVESQAYQAVVENVACEMAARMVAMKSATDNAGKVIDELQLVYNKARQAAITQEISEIVSGAAAV